MRSTSVEYTEIVMATQLGAVQKKKTLNFGAPTRFAASVTYFTMKTFAARSRQSSIVPSRRPLYDS